MDGEVTPSPTRGLKIFPKFLQADNVRSSIQQDFLRPVYDLVPKDKCEKDERT